MADTERLLNKAQGDSIISALAQIAANILQVPSEKLIIDWSYTTLPVSGDDHTIYAIPTGDADDPWNFYVWNDVDEEWVQFDWTFAVDSALSTTSENPVQNKVVTAALNDKVDKVTGKGLSTNDYTDAEKTKLAGIEQGAEVNVQSDWAQTDSNADDYIKNKQLVTEPIEELQNDVQSTQTATGNPLTLTDAAPINAESLVVELEPIQEGSGDPSPTNVRPITGYTECEVDDVGFNQWDEEWELGGIDVTTGENTFGTEWSRSKNYTHVMSNTAYYYKHDGINMGIRYYDASKNYIGYEPSSSTSGAKTTPTNCKYVRFTWNASTYNNDISINYPSTDHDYHPYQSTSATIQFGQTVYGGSVDFLTGVLTVDRASVDLGSLNWGYSAISDHERMNSNSISNSVLPNMNPNNTPKIVCSQYIADSPNGIYLHRKDKSITVDQTQLAVWDSSYTDAAAFKTAMSGVQLVYELATPFTIQLTPDELKLLKGTNNLSADGVMQIGYQPDNVIGEVKGEIENATPISGTVTATLLHEEDQGEDWIVGFTGEINGHFDTDHFDYYLTARYSHAYNTNIQILNMDNCIDGDYVQIWQTGTLDFSVDGGVTVTISVTATKLTFTVNCIGASIFGIYSSSETTGQVKYLITPARKG